MVSRMEIADLIEPAFVDGSARRADILGAAIAGDGRAEVIEVLEQLPDRSFLELRDLWSEIPHVPVEV